MDLNKVMLIGRLTRDPEVKTTPQGVTVTTFGLATGRVWKDAQGNQQDKTEFHNVVAWRRLGEIAGQYLAKGRQIYIEGHLQTRSWESEPGKKQYRTEVVADNMIMLGNKGDQPSPKATADKPAPMPTPETITAAPVGEDEIRIEDIPF
jgi:single-strand DNA-binding protein